MNRTVTAAQFLEAENISWYEFMQKVISDSENFPSQAVYSALKTTYFRCHYCGSWNGGSFSTFFFYAVGLSHTSVFVFRVAGFNLAKQILNLEPTTSRWFCVGGDLSSLDSLNFLVCIHNDSSQLMFLP